VAEPAVFDIQGFIVFLPETNKEIAFIVAEKLRQSMKEETGLWTDKRLSWLCY
jgi:hypothetical protein